MSSPSLPLLVIPYEIVVREIDGAVLLAHLYSRYGGKTLIGQKSSLFPLIPCLKGSIWFLKSIVPGEIYLSKKLKDNNCRILSYDVEGLVPSEGAVGILQRFSEESLSYVDQHFCWSFDEYQRYISVFPHLKDKFSVSGIPIQESWDHYCFDKSSISKRNILLVSSFPFACSQSLDYNIEQSKSCSNSFAEKESHLLKEISMQKDGYFLTKQLLDYLIDHDFHVTIRKHPAEIENLWKSYLASPNVSFDSGIQPIAKSICENSNVICFNSTVSVQASSMLRPCFQLLPDYYLRQYSSVLSSVALMHTYQFTKPVDVLNAITSNLPPKLKTSFPPSSTKFLVSYLLQYKSVKSTSFNHVYLLFLYRLSRLKILFLYTFSRIPLFCRLFANYALPKEYYKVGNNKCPIDTATAIPLSMSALRLDPSEFTLSKITRNLVEISPRSFS